MDTHANSSELTVTEIDLIYILGQYKSIIETAAEAFSPSLIAMYAYDVAKQFNKLYNELNISCQPIAINSGNTWPKHGQKKINTTLTVSILKPIEPGLSKEIFTKELENTIYSELNILN
mgnify:CR=1 FL=1